MGTTTTTTATSPTLHPICVKSFPNDNPPDSPDKNAYDLLKLTIAGTGDENENGEYPVKADDPGFQYPYVGDNRLIKIPHSAFMDGSYINKLEANKNYHFAVALFDPYTIRCGIFEDTPGHWNPFGHTSVFSVSEWNNCIAKGPHYNQFKYAGHFQTGADKRIIDWNNWSGHFQPRWIALDGKQNGKIFQKFWGWPEASSHEYVPYFDYKTIIMSISLVFNIVLFSLLICAICSICVAVHGYFIYKVQSDKGYGLIARKEDMNEV